jgi:hypothetical protein
MAIESSYGRERQRARLVKCGALAASATALLAAVPAAGAHTFSPGRFGQRSHQVVWGNDRLRPDSLAISATVYPSTGAGFVAVGQDLPYASNYSGPSTQSPPRIRVTPPRSLTVSTPTCSTTPLPTVASV